MTCKLFARVILFRTAFVVFLLTGSSSFSQAAENESAENRFAAHLAAGEFGPARKLADQAGRSRDHWMQQLATAQARAGAWGASLSTARAIQNDTQRQAAYGQLSGSRTGSGGRGGAAMADFDTLIDLIQSTIAPDTWADAGGTGAVEPFPGGVFVDSAGTMKRIVAARPDMELSKVRRAAFSDSGNRDIRQTSMLRKVSLTRLERQAQWLAAQGKRPDEAMRLLAGMTRVKYVFVYPQTRDIVIAGPAGDWTVDGEGRAVNSESRQPVLWLDDLVVLLRNAVSDHGRFTCSITPRRENLAEVQTFLAESAKRPLRPGERDEWIASLRERLGDQDITVQGLDPRTRAARILVEADYRMKLVGMGLEPAVLGVKSYLDSVEVPPGESPPPMDVLRWWFTLNYDAVKTTEPHDVFEVVGPGVKVLSENELLTERGERVHTGATQHLNQLFAQSFTKHFAELAAKYPIYGELRNVFDLALVAALIHHQDLAGQCNWEMTFFGPRGQYEPERGVAPKQVASIVNYRQIDRRQFIVGVSGGVSVDTRGFAQTAAMKTDSYGLLKAERGNAQPPQLAASGWWWD